VRRRSVGLARAARSGGMPAVLYDTSPDGRIATVSLNRPAVLNAYNVEMRDALYEALLAVRDDPEVRVMVLRGEGRAFSTGGDLREFGAAPSPVAARTSRWRRDVWGLLWSLPQLTLAAVHGLAVGGGLEMMLLCDQAIASTNTRFALPETRLAMIPGVGGTQTLPRLVGEGRALDLVLTGRWFTARTARDLGLVSRVVPLARLERTAGALARRWAGLEPGLVRRLKHMVQGEMS
jgi:enoyl-CoA hydratase